MNEKNSSNSLIAQYYRQHFEELKAFASKRLGYADMAEDMVQNVFLRLLSSDKMISKVTLPCLVYTIMRNLIFDHWRRKHSYDEYEHYIQRRDTDKAVEPESVYSAAEIHEMLEKGMERLSERQRTVYQLHVYDGMKVSDISQTLHLNYKCVENRLGQARKEMRTYMRRMLA